MENLYSQSGWNSLFFNNYNTITKVVAKDSVNYFAFCYDSKYYFKSSNAGNNWQSIKEFALDSIYNIYDAQFINSQTGWVVGEYSYYSKGVIIKTTNGGLTWVKQNSGFNNSSNYCLCFINENTGWVSSSISNSIGCLLKTTNGGNNWVKQDFPGSYEIRYVKFFDTNNAWILGNRLIATTTNGGLNWQTKIITNIPYNYANNISMLSFSINECIALVTSLNNLGMVYSNLFRTTNSGYNWNLIYSYTDSLTSNGNSFYRIFNINPSTYFLNGSYKYVSRTTNAGVNWTLQNVISILSTKPTIFSLFANNSNELFAGGGYSGNHFTSLKPYNFICKSTNIGSNWSIKNLSYPYTFIKITFTDTETGFAVADSGIILKTSNSGINWNICYKNSNFKISSLDFGNRYNGCASGSIFNTYVKLICTTDGGSSWQEISFPQNHLLSVVKYLNANTVFTAGSAKCFKSTNSGLNWHECILPIVQQDQNASDIGFKDDTIGYLLNWEFHSFGYYYITNLLKTTDAGENWVAFFSTNSGTSPFTNFQMLSNGTGYLLKKDKLLKTTNWGNNWSIFSTNLSLDFTCLKMFNSNTGWIGGSNLISTAYLYKTTNSGINWLLQFTDYYQIPRNIFALSSSKAWFCGDYSSIYGTTNGGGMIIGINNEITNSPNNFSLSQNYPNPFNPSTTIKFDIPKSSHVQIVVYDMLGREVEQLLNDERKPGSYEVMWDGSRYSSGVYFYKIITDEFVQTKRMVLMK